MKGFGTNHVVIKGTGPGFQQSQRSLFSALMLLALVPARAQGCREGVRRLRTATACGGEGKEGSGWPPASWVLKNGAYFQENKNILLIHQFVSVKVKQNLDDSLSPPGTWKETRFPTGKCISSWDCRTVRNAPVGSMWPLGLGRGWQGSRAQTPASPTLSQRDMLITSLWSQGQVLELT